MPTTPLSVIKYIYIRTAIDCRARRTKTRNNFKTARFFFLFLPRVIPSNVIITRSVRFCVRPCRSVVTRAYKTSNNQTDYLRIANFEREIYRTNV